MRSIHLSTAAADRNHFARLAVCSDVEDDLLGVRDLLIYASAPFVGRPRDFGRGLQQATLNRSGFDEMGVMLDVHRRRHGIQQGGEIGRTTNRSQFLALFESRNAR